MRTSASPRPRSGRVGAVLVALALMVGLGLVPTGSASAATVGQSSSKAGVFFTNCISHYYTYSFTLPADELYSWNFRVRVLDPHQKLVDTESEYGESANARGNGTVYLCNLPSVAGRYTLRIKGTYTKQHSSTHYKFRLKDSHFRMRLARTRTTLHARSTRAGCREPISFDVRATAERRTKYVAEAFSPVVLQSHRGGSWHDVRGTHSTTDNRGRVVLHTAHGAPCGAPLTLRAHVRPTDGSAPSSSAPVTIRSRG